MNRHVQAMSYPPVPTRRQTGFLPAPLLSTVSTQMATTQDNVKIEINIAGEPIKLTVPFDRQDSVRDCEKAVNSLYSEWRHKFPRKSHSELIAMIAYQYAYFFLELSALHDARTAGLHNISDRLDALLSPAPQAPDTAE